MIEFGTSGIRGSVQEVVRPEAVIPLCRAVGAEADEVALARDGRLSGPALIRAASAGLVSGGADVDCLGVTPTPELAFASTDRWGIIITASHNPPSDNGIKVFRDGEEIDRETERRLEEAATANLPPVRWDRWGRIRHASVRDQYLDAVTSLAQPSRTPETEVKVALDCGNGTAGVIAPTALQRLGATVQVLHGTVDGRFPSRPSKPTAETVVPLRNEVKAKGFDAGFAFDGDADRLLVVGSDGEVVHEDVILAILSRRAISAVEAENPVVVVTVNVSSVVETVVERAGGRLERADIGSLHSVVKDLKDAGETVVFAGEPWKHVFPSHGRWMDAIASASVITGELLAGTTLSALQDGIPAPAIRKRSFPCPESEKADAIDRSRSAITEGLGLSVIPYDTGFRATWEQDGWLLIRPSGTEPKLRLYLEHPDSAQKLQDISLLIEQAIERTEHS